MAIAVGDPREAGYREAQGAALRALAVRAPWLSQDERLDLYNEVWARLLERERDEGFWPDNLEAYLVGAVGKRSRHEARTRATRRTYASDPLSGPLQASDGDAMEERVMGELDADALRAVIAGLTPLQRTICKLRFDWQLAPREIASVLNVETKRCYRELEYATERLRREARKVQRGEHVRRYEKVLRRYLAGTASDSERAEALRLIETSRQARMIASEMRRQALELGALLPAPVLAAAEPRSRALELAVGLKEQLLGAKEEAAAALTGAKQHAAGAYYRAVDPTPLSGVRPGAAATAIAGCLALGGGATYCIESGVDPLGELKGVVEPQREKRAPEPPKKQPAVEHPPPPSVTPLPPDPQPRQEPAAPAAEPASPPPAPPAPEQEFEPTSPAGSRTAPTQSSSSTTSRQPAPAPPDGVGEFGGP